MRLLALDTSTRYASIAICSDDENAGVQSICNEYTWYTGSNHNVDILENIQRLLHDGHVTFQELDAICVATGPGSFNGVRVAVATAKALAFTLQKPLIGVSTLDLIAAQQRLVPYLIGAVLEAGRGDLYTAFYRMESTTHDDGVLDVILARRSEYLLLPATHIAEQALSLLNSDIPLVLFCGEMSKLSQQALHAALPEQSRFANKNQSIRHASLLAEIGWQRLHANLIDDPLLLEPMYLRRPSITASTRKQPLLGGSQSQPTTQQTTLSATQSEREEGALHH